MTTATKKRGHRYRPRGNSSKLFSCHDSEILLSGPAGTGKSRACMEKLHFMALKYPGMRGAILRKTASTLSSTALVTWRRFVATESILEEDCWYYGGSAQEPPGYKYKNGSFIAIGGLDKVSKIMSSEYDVVYVQEATELTEDEWESITTRLRNWIVSYQQLIADCNPSHPTHWLKARCDVGRVRLFETQHEDNPVLFDDNGTITERGASYISKLDRLTGVRYARLRKGVWAAAEGVIYEDFSDFHIIDAIPAEGPLDAFGVPISWQRYWSVDFGFVNPFVIQCWAEDHDGRLYMYREIYHTHRTSDQHAKKLLSIVRPEGVWLEPQPSAIICDHDAEGRELLERELGLSTSPAHKSVLEGIECGQRRMRNAGDGKPRIFFLRNAIVERDQDLVDASKPTCTIEEIPGYTWKANRDGSQSKDEPNKEDDHGCDAMRYMVAEKDFGIRVLFRSFTA